MLRVWHEEVKIELRRFEPLYRGLSNEPVGDNSSGIVKLTS
jgi:hypothetical protein